MTPLILNLVTKYFGSHTSKVFVFLSAN